MRIRTIVGILVVLVVAVVAAGVVIVKSIDLNQYRPMIAQKIEETTGRKTTLAGQIYLDIWNLTPSVAIEDVSFANASWGSRPDMAKLKRLEAQVALMPLLHKHIEIKRFVLVSPDILLETDASGKGNWEFGTAAPGAAAMPPAGAPKAGAPTQPPAPEQPAAAPAGGNVPQFSINAVEIKDGTLTYIDGKTKKATTLALKDFTAKADNSTSPLKISIDGEFNKAPFKVAGTVGALADLQAPRAPFPIDIEAEAGGATVKAKGSIAQPAAVKGIDLNLSVEGKTLGDLAAFAPGLPAIGPYSLAGHVADKDANIVVSQLKAVLGKSDLAGDVTLVKADKPTVKANLTSNLIDLAELQDAAGGATTAPAPAGGNANAPAAAGAGGEAKPAAKSGDGRLFSDAPLPLAGLKTANADIKLTAAKVVTKGPPLQNVNATLSLVNGKLTINPLTADVVGGHIDNNTTLDASGATPTLALNARAKDLDVATLVKELKVEQKVTGKANFEGVANGSGQSVRAIMAGLDGHTDLNIVDMRVDNTLMKIVMADLAKAVTGQGDASNIRCIVSHFDISKGLATSRQLTVDAESVTIQGKGTINLATEQLDLYLDPSPKAAAVVDLAIPVKVTGTLASPSASPDPAGVAKKLGSTVAGAAGAVTGGGIAGGVLGKVLGGKATGGEQPAATAPASGGDPCAATTAAATPANATTAAPAVKPGAAAPPATAQPAQKPANPIEDVGSKLKGLFGN